MGLVIICSPPPPPPRLRRGWWPSGPRRRLAPLRTLRPSEPVTWRFGNVSSDCFATNINADLDHTATEDETGEDRSTLPSGCSLPIVNLTSDIVNSKSLNLLTEETLTDSLFTTLPSINVQVLSEEEQEALAATPAHPAGLYALYASFLAGNLVEQLWSFAWPAAVATLHPSLLPVAVMGFCTKLAIFIGGPLLGNLMDSFPRIPAYYSLNLVQTAAQLLSAGMIVYALKNAGNTTASTLIFQPWFIVLAVAGAIERLTGLSLGVTVERDWVVLLAGTNRPVALAQANATLNRIDLLSEIAGASFFGILLSKYNSVTCLKIASGLIMCTLPVLVILGYLINRLSSGVLDRSRFSHTCDRDGPLFNMEKIVEDGFNAIKLGWMEYKHQPVLPASVAYVLLYFNIALTPGSIMTAFLTHNGISPSIIGGFSGLCAFMGIAATFISSSLVKKLGILKAGAAGLIFQASCLTVAVAVFWSNSISHKTPLLFFLSLIVLSRLGHMSYDVMGTQILQTGIPANKANLIGTTEVSIASLAEFIMLGVAIVANDVSHFGFLATLSLSSVIGAAWMFCYWLSNPTDEQRALLTFDPQFSF